MTIDFFKTNYPNLYKGEEYYFEHNQTAIEYVVRAYTEGYDSGKMSAEDKFKDKIDKLEQENRILKAKSESYESQIKYFEGKSKKLEEENKTLDAYAQKLTSTKIDETMKNRVTYLEEENRKLKADNERLSDSLTNTTKTVKTIKSTFDILNTVELTDTQLASILAERGYKGELTKTERLYNSNMQSSVGEKLETIKLK